MSKSYSVDIDGKAYTLKYGIDDRETVEATFPRPDGTPGSLGAMVRGNLIEAGSFKLQTTIIWAGLRHNGKACTYDKVRDAMVKASQNGGIGALLEPVRNAILASGVLGRIVDPEPEPEDEEGKAPTS